MKKGFLALAFTLLLTAFAAPALAADEATPDLAATLWAWVVDTVAAIGGDEDDDTSEVGHLMLPGG